MVSPKDEDYLKTIYALQVDDDPVRPSDIAAELDVTPPTVTSMTKKLHEQGLVERQPYSGVTLTKDGERVALEVLRHHRLLELFLTEEFDYSWAEVHEEADRLEHHISETLEQKLAAVLNDPAVDPHGEPIPTVDLDPIAEADTLPLTECETDDIVIVRQVADRDSNDLAYLADEGITLGAELTVTDVSPFGVHTIEPAERDTLISLPEEVAATVFVEPRTDSQSPVVNANGVV